MSFADKKMDFTFKAPGAGADASAKPDAPVMPETDEPAEYTPDELGAALAESIKSGSGQAVYEAIAKIVSNCQG